MRKLFFIGLLVMLAGGREPLSAKPRTSEVQDEKEAAAPPKEKNDAKQTKDDKKPKAEGAIASMPDGEGAEARYRAALKAIKGKKFKRAFRILKKLGQDEAQKSRAYLLIGTMYYDKNRVAKAKKYFDDAGAEPILTKETAFAYGATHLEYEEFAKAILGLKTALKLKSGPRVEARYKIGVAYFKLGQYLRSERYFESINPKTLNSALRLERQRYLVDIRNRHDAFLASIGAQESEVRSVEGSPWDFEPPDPHGDKLAASREVDWRIRWRPLAMLHQESLQNLNKGNGRDASELLSHRVGTRAYAGGNPAQKSFGSLEFGLGYTGFELREEASRSFEIPEAVGEFLSQKIDKTVEENLFINFQPMINTEISKSMRAEIGGGISSFLPNNKVSQSWGQVEALLRLRIEGATNDGGLELAVQQPFDTKEHEKALDYLGKLDFHQQLGEMGIRFYAQHWSTENPEFKFFSRERMSLVDQRFKYHLGFDSEMKAGVIGTLALGELSLRASYDFTTRSSKEGIERLSLSDDPSLVAKQANMRMFGAAYPLWETLVLQFAFGSQNLTGYTFRQRDPLTQAVRTEYVSNVNQTLFQFGVGFSPLDWMKLRLSFAQGGNHYQNEGSADDAFQIANPRSSESSVMHVEFSKNF